MALDYVSPASEEFASESTEAQYPDRPRPVVVDSAELLPATLRNLDRWGNWSRDLKLAKDAPKTKWSKCPYNGRFRTASTNPGHWTGISLPLIRLINAVRDVPYDPCATDLRIDGLGFAFFAEDNLRGVDVDNCIDPETGEINAVGQKALELFGGKTYIEWSPSGTGFHIFVRSVMAIPPGQNKNLALGTELYGDGRFFTVTANRLPQSADDVNELGECDADLAEWMAYTYNANASQRKQADVSVLDNGLVIDPNAIVSKDVLFRMRTLAPRAYSAFLGERDHEFLDRDGAVDRNRVDMSLVSLMAQTEDTEFQPVFTQQEIIDAAIQARRTSGAKEKSSPTYYWTRTLAAVLACDEDTPTEIDMESEPENESTASAEGIERSEPAEPAEVVATPVTDVSPVIAEAEQIVAAKTDTPDMNATPREDKRPLNKLFIDPSDVGNADRFVKISYKTRRWSKENKSWMVLDPEEKLWAEDNDAAAYSIRSVVDDIQRDIKRLDEIAEDENTEKPNREIAEKAANAARRWAITCKSGSHPETMLKQARAPLAIASDVFDKDPMLFATRDGVINLTTGVCRERMAEDYLTKRTMVNYNPNVQAPVFHDFLNCVFDDDVAMIDYVQRFFGYCLTGSVEEQKMGILYGDGQNGKSTLVSAIGDAMGQHAKAVATSLLTLRGYTGGNTPDKVELKGLRLAIATEPNETARLDEAQIKTLTGGDIVTATAKYKNPITFKPTHKFVLMTNHKPEVSGTDKGIWRRLVLIPMTVEIPDDEIDPHLGEKLKAEAEGILAWLVEGCIKWQQRGLNRDVPVAVQAATETWRKEEDFIGAFIDDVFEIDPLGIEMTAHVLKAYHAYVSENTLGDVSMNTRRLKKELEKRGFKAAHKREGNVYCGLRLNAVYHDMVHVA